MRRALVLIALAACDDAAPPIAAPPTPPPKSERSLSGGPAVNLHLAVVDAQDPVAVGETVELTLTLSNQSRRVPLTQAQLTYVVPEQFEWVSSVPEANYSPGSRTARWDARLVKEGMERRVVLRASRPGWAIHRVMAGIENESELLMKDEPTFVGAGPGLHVEIADERDPVHVGETARVTLTVRNEGSATLAGVTIALEAPFGAAPVAESIALAPGEARILRAEVRAAEKGLHRFRGSVRFDGLGDTAWVEESVAVVD